MTTGPPTVSETIQYYHTDALGSVRLITDAGGQVVAANDYLPFGDDWQPTGDLDARGFAQMERTWHTGIASWGPLNYAGARYYHSQTGRFTSPDDPSYIDPLNPQTWNLYAYVMNNPLRWVDPSGNQAQCTEGPGYFCSGVVADGGLSPEMQAAIERAHGTLIELPLPDPIAVLWRIEDEVLAPYRFDGQMMLGAAPSPVAVAVMLAARLAPAAGGAAEIGRRIAGTHGLQHSFSRHASEWFGRGVPASTHMSKWQSLLERAATSSRQVPWSTGGDRTIAACGEKGSLDYAR